MDLVFDQLVLLAGLAFVAQPNPELPLETGDRRPVLGLPVHIPLVPFICVKEYFVIFFLDLQKLSLDFAVPLQPIRGFDVRRGIFQVHVQGYRLSKIIKLTHVREVLIFRVFLPFPLLFGLALCAGKGFYCFGAHLVTVHPVCCFW